MKSNFLDTLISHILKHVTYFYEEKYILFEAISVQESVKNK